MKKNALLLAGIMSLSFLTGCSSLQESYTKLQNFGYGEVINVTLHDGVSTEKEVTSALKYPSNRNGGYYLWSACHIEESLGTRVRINVTSITSTGGRTVTSIICHPNQGSTFRTRFYKGILAEHKV